MSSSPPSEPPVPRVVRPVLAAVALAVGCAAALFGSWGGLPGSAAVTARPSDPPVVARSALETQAKRLPVVTRPVVVEALPVHRLAVGRVEPSEEVAVRTRIDGEIVRQFVVEGQMVSAGAALFKLDDREIRARVARSEALLARDKSRLGWARTDLAKVRQLVGKAAASQSRLDQAIAAVEIVEAEVAAGEATLAMDRIALEQTLVVAPIAGRVGDIDVTPGSFVSRPERGADVLLTVSKLSPAFVSFALPEKDLGPLRRAAAAAGSAGVPVEVSAGPSGEALASGRISFIESAIDRGTATISVRATVDNADQSLWPGQFVQVSVDLGRHDDAVTVPLASIVSGPEGPHLFTVTPDGRAAVRALRSIEARGDRAAVTAEGLDATQPVVVEGQWRLDAGSRVAVDPELAVADRESAIESRRP